MEHDTVLIFDGDCSFCSSCVDWLEDNLPAMPRTVPYQWADLGSYALSLDEAREKVWLITAERHYGGASAVTAILRHQPERVYRFLGWLLATPPLSRLADGAYWIVSRLRHVLPGGTPTCRR